MAGKFTVNLSRTTGTITATQTAKLDISADSAAGATRLALEQVADDASDVVWTTVPAAATAAANGVTVHVTSVTTDK